MWNENLYLAALFGTLCCLILALYFFYKNRTINSTSIGLFVWISISLCMLFIEPFIFSPTKNIPLDRFIWYGSFAVLDGLAIYLINNIHRRNQIKLNRDSLVINVAFFTLLTAQVIRYFDKQVLGTNLLGELYKQLIPAVNIMTWAYIVCAIVINKAERKEGVKSV